MPIGPRREADNERQLRVPGDDHTPRPLVLSQIPGKKSSVSLEFFPGLEFLPIFNDNIGQGAGYLARKGIMAMYRSNHGFTLVELLVVITIIGILMALIIPAVNSVKEQGRQTTCMNNQMQIAKAMVAYESAKNHLPGVINMTSGGVQYTWVEALFPYLDRSDLWNTVSSGGTLQTLVGFRVAICPNDPYLVDPTATTFQALLSYGVNDGFFVSYVNSNNTRQPPGGSK